MLDFKIIETNILEFWKKQKIYEKSVKKNKKGKLFYFLQGPPYTSGKIHIGHVWNNSLKDIILRYKRLNGFNVWDRAGYDMHGLPIANKIQKQLKLKDKEDIIKYGIDKFVKKCYKFAVKNKEIMDKDLKRFGIWMDFKNAYLPIKNEFISSEWMLIKKAFEQKRLYRGEKIMQWCAECETSLAKHELEYKNILDKSIYVKFKLKNKEGYLVIWTTTPWTIPFNLAVMVNPDLEYIKVKTGEEIYVIAEKLAKKFFKEILKKDYKVLNKFKGNKMVGWEYIHPFKDIVNYEILKKDSPKIHTVFLSKKYVNLDAGTGLVHCAPGCGPEDYEVGRKNNVKPFNKINEKGIFCDIGEFNGLIAKKNDKEFIEILRDKKALAGEEDIFHEYAHCWRCHNPVVFRLTKQWFLKIEDLVKKILNYNKKIHWVPESAKKSYELWIKNLKDNGVTRQRFWGCPMPIWLCECGKIEVIGSKNELAKKAVNKIPNNLHKPWIDKVKLKCKCGKEMKRILDILDVWIDSGTASWNSLYYPQEQKYFDKYFPADLILEATEQTRLWFSMLQICSEIMFKKSSYKNVYAHGMIFDFQGTKMSKSLGNIISPYEVVDKYSSDILRYYICEINAGENISFNWEDIKQKQRNLIILINIENYLNDLINQKSEKKKKINLDIEEEYILSKTNSYLKKITLLFENYKLDKTITEIEKLFLDLSRVYIKLTRNKSNDSKTREIVFNTVLEVYIKCLEMFSTICPLITEKIWQDLRKKNLVKEESIHLTNWPKIDEEKINKKLEEEFELVLEIIEKGLAVRDNVKIGLKWPLKKAIVSTNKQINEELLEIIKNQLNVKEIEIKKVKTKELFVKLDTKLTKELEAEGYAREIIRKIQANRKKAGLIKTDKINLALDLDDNFKKIIENQIDFIKKRTNSNELLIKNIDNKNYKEIFRDKIKTKNIMFLFSKIN